ncbi:MAG: TIGR01212 family radical SAM protein [Flavobacteriales bacterium]|nr:TIGR01212 family radical SAM protein [Flavobacteriales bacterium]
MALPMTYPWGDSLPYNSTAERYKERYGGRMQKISLSGDFTCPNRDGRVGTGGCTFCSNDSFVPFYAIGKDIDRQIDEGLLFLKERYPRTAHFLGYFQAYTNTYGNVEEIKKLYLHVLSRPEIDGLVIGTRPDCIDDELLDFFAQLNEKHFISIEYGVESTDDDTLRRVNRGHDYATSVDAICRTHERGIHTAAHFIWGLEDTLEKMPQQVNEINKLPLDSVKFHQLQIIRSTVMEKKYLSGQKDFYVFEKPQQYADFIIEVIERLRPTMPIERFISETPPRYRIAPQWGLDLRVPQMRENIIRQMKDEKRWQGRIFLLNSHR